MITEVRRCCIGLECALTPLLMRVYGIALSIIVVDRQYCNRPAWATVWTTVNSSKVCKSTFVCCHLACISSFVILPKLAETTNVLYMGRGVIRRLRDVSLTANYHL